MELQEQRERKIYTMYQWVSNSSYKRAHALLVLPDILFRMLGELLGILERAVDRRTTNPLLHGFPQPVAAISHRAEMKCLAVRVRVYSFPIVWVAIEVPIDLALQPRVERRKDFPSFNFSTKEVAYVT